MPEFILDTSGVVEHGKPLETRTDSRGRPEVRLHVGADRKPDLDVSWDDLTPFAQGCVEALFFTEDEELRSEAADRGAGHDDGEPAFCWLAAESVASIIADCAAFQASDAWREFESWRAGCDGDEATDEQAGRDFWFTRCGHGVGFWDRPVTFYGTHADALTDAAHAVGNRDVYLGDNGKVYLS